MDKVKDNIWVIVNNKREIVADTDGTLTKLNGSNPLKDKNFLVNSLGYVCEFYIKEDKLKTKGLSNEFHLENEEGLSNIKDDIEMKVYNNGVLVDIEELKHELDIISSEEVYKIYVEDGESVCELLEGWTAKYN